MNTTTQSNEKAVQPVVLPVDLRDYFAAQAMQAILHTSMRAAGSDGSVSFDLVAAAAYRMADAMLKAREGA